MEYPEDYIKILLEEFFNEDNNKMTVEELRQMTQKAYGEKCIEDNIAKFSFSEMERGPIMEPDTPNLHLKYR